MYISFWEHHHLISKHIIKSTEVNFQLNKPQIPSPVDCLRTKSLFHAHCEAKMTCYSHVVHAQTFYNLISCHTTLH